MTENCFDSGTVQAFLDGELASDRLETVSRHISVCDDCAILLAEAEEETAFAFSALELEFNTLVPTNRLWTKINDSIEQQKKPFWHSIFAFISKPTIAAFAGLLIFVGLFAAFSGLKINRSENLVAEIVPAQKNAISPTSKYEAPSLTVRQSAQNSPEISGAKSVATAADKNSKTEYSAAKATFSEKRNNRRTEKSGVIKRISPLKIDVAPRIGDANLSGEESYVKTITALTKTVNLSKDEVLKPAARFAFERDLAVTDDAIKKMKAEVGKNPKNEAARDVLRASYQNKIDLLNSVAEKSELMASLK